MDANEFLNSKGLLYTRELININDERINIIELLNEYKALSQHNVISRRELLLDFAEYSENDKTSTALDECVDNYLDSIKQ